MSEEGLCETVSDYRAIDRKFPDWDEATTFVISGPCGRGKSRGPVDEARRFPNPQAAREWAEKKYGHLYHNGANLCSPKSMRWAFRVPRPRSSDE